MAMERDGNVPPRTGPAAFPALGDKLLNERIIYHGSSHAKLLAWLRGRVLKEGVRAG
jgi:hypothetical protein